MAVRYQHVNKNAAAAVTDPSNEIIVAGPGETPASVAARKTANNALAGVSRIAGPAGLTVRISANPTAKSITVEAASDTSETLKIEATSGTSFLLASPTNGNLQSGIAYPSITQTGQGSYTQIWNFAPRSGVSGSGVPNERILLTFFNGTRTTTLSFVPFACNKFTIMTASNAVSLYERIDGTNMLVEGGSPGGYFVTSVMSDGTEQPYTGTGTYSFGLPYPNGMGVTAGANATMGTAVLNNSINGDGFLTIIFTFPSGRTISRRVWMKESASGATMPNYLKYSRIDGTVTLPEGGSPQQYSIANILADNTLQAYTGSGTFSLVAPYPNGMGVTPVSNGVGTTFVPANSLSNDAVIPLKYTMADGTVLYRNLLLTNSTPVTNSVSPVQIPTGPTGSETWTALTTNGSVGQLASNSGLSQTPTSSVVSGNTVINLSVYIGGFQDIGNGVKTGSCYFSADNGITAKFYGAIAAGDKLYWNGNIAGFNLDPTDTITIYYGTPSGTP